MKDKQARVLAIIALVFMVLFVVALTATLIDYKLLNGAVGYVALCTGVFVLMIFIALKADGRGYSITKMNNEIEMEKIKKALEEQQKEEEAQKTAESDSADSDAESTGGDGAYGKDNLSDTAEPDNTDGNKDEA